MITAQKARELLQLSLVKEKCNSLNEVYAMIVLSSEKGVAYLSNIKLMPEDYYRLCDDGYIIKSMDNGYSIAW